MIMITRVLRILIFVGFISGMMPAVASHAFWVWTPETGKFINPKNHVKATPQEQLEYAVGFYHENDCDQGVKEFEKLIKNYPRAREAADAQFYIASCQEKEGALFKAYKEYQLVLDKYPFSDKAGEVVKKQYDIGNAMLEGKDRKNKIIKTIIGGSYDVIEVFRTVIKNAPYGPYAPSAQYKIGLYLHEKGLYQEARDEFEKTINDYPESEWAKAAKYQIALADSQRSSEAQYDQQVTKSAIEEFKEFAKEYPDAELSQKAKDEVNKLKEKEAENNFVVAQFYEKQKKYQAARLYYSSIVENYKNTSWAPKALEKLQALKFEK
ncbi:MAG: outer membrane protein assembly factor BamD [Candidatus Omnitrophica bacterium]|nr:outer membrane protein assembly factor BamD [Candidatus Omnitrophota bacterium]